MIEKINMWICHLKKSRGNSFKIYRSSAYAPSRILRAKLTELARLFQTWKLYISHNQKIEELDTFWALDFNTTFLNFFGSEMAEKIKVGKNVILVNPRQNDPYFCLKLWSVIVSTCIGCERYYRVGLVGVH